MSPRSASYDLPNLFYSQLEQYSMSRHFGEFLTVQTGMPQGALLGSILFLIYVSNLANILNNGSIISFKQMNNHNCKNFHICNCSGITKSEKVKYLGVMVDQNLLVEYLSDKIRITFVC